MNTKWIILGFLLVVGLLIAACTTTGSSPVAESEAVVTVAAATAVPPTLTPETVKINPRFNRVLASSDFRFRQHQPGWANPTGE